jgi:hypothetical protein
VCTRRAGHNEASAATGAAAAARCEGYVEQLLSVRRLSIPRWKRSRAWGVHVAHRGRQVRLAIALDDVRRRARRQPRQRTRAGEAVRLVAEPSTPSIRVA